MHSKATHFTYYAADSHGLVVDGDGPAAPLLHRQHAGSGASDKNDSGRRRRVEFGRVVERSASPVDDADQSPDVVESSRRAAIRVRASERDRCVAPSMTKPKRRLTIKDGESYFDGAGPPSVSDGMRWTQESYDVRDIARMFDGKFPAVVKVTEMESNRSLRSMTVGQNFVVQGCSQHRRVLCELLDTEVESLAPGAATESDSYDVVNAVISIPLDYQMNICVEEFDEDVAARQTIAVADVVLPLANAIQVKRLPLNVRVVNTAENNSDLIKWEQQKMQLIGTHRAVFLHACAISNGWVDQSELLMIPDCVGIKLSIAVGLILSTDQEWDDYRNMLLRCVRHLAPNDAVDGVPDLLLIPNPLVNNIQFENSFHGDTSVDFHADDVGHTHLKRYDAADNDYAVLNLDKTNRGISSQTAVISDENKPSKRRTTQLHAYDNVAFRWSKNSHEETIAMEQSTMTDESDDVNSAAIINLVTSDTLQPKQHAGRRTVGSESVELRNRLSHAGDSSRLRTTTSMSSAVSEVNPDELGKIFDSVLHLVNEQERRLEVDLARKLEMIPSSSSSNRFLHQASSLSAVDKSETKSTDEGYDTKRNTMDEPTTTEVANKMAEMLVRTAAAEGCSVNNQNEREVTTGPHVAQVSGRRPIRVWPPAPEVSESPTHNVAVESSRKSPRIAPIPRARKSSDKEQTMNPSTTVAAPKPAVKPKSPAVHPPPKTAAVASRQVKLTTPSSTCGVPDAQSIALLSENITCMSAIELVRCLVEELGINQLEVDRMVAAGFDGRQLGSATPEQLMKRFQMTPFNANKLIRFARGWRPTK